MQVLILLGAEATAVILEVFVAGKALGAASTAELVVARVGALVLSEMGAAAEGLAAQGALVELHAWLGGEVSERRLDPSTCTWNKTQPLGLPAGICVTWALLPPVSSLTFSQTLSASHIRSSQMHQAGSCFPAFAPAVSLCLEQYVQLPNLS